MSKVTILTSTPPTKGISKYSVALIEALAEKQDVEVLSFRRMYPNALYPGGVYDQSLRPLKKSTHIRLRRFLTWYNPLGWIYAGLTAKGKVLHVQWWSYVLAPVYVTVMLFAKLRGRKVLVTMHNVKPHEAGLVKNLANKIVASFGDHFIVHTDGGKKDFVREYKKPADKVTVIPHGILLPDSGVKGVSSSEARKELNIPATAKVLLFFGIIRDYKGLDVLLEAFAKVRQNTPDAYMIVAGKPWQDWDIYQRIIDKHDLAENMRLDLKFIPEDDIEMYYRAADVAVLPYKYFDAQSGAGALALPFGKAMVVTNEGGLPDLVRSEKAIAKANDIDDLTEKITAILGDEKLRRSLEKDSLELAKKYSWDTIAQQTIEVYQNL